MNVTIVDFYKDVTGNASNTQHVRDVLARWSVPCFTNTKGDSHKKFWKVDVKYLEQAKAAHQAELDAAERVRKTRNGNVTPTTTNEAHSLMERMAAVEEQLRTLNTQLADLLSKIRVSRGQ